MRVLNIHKRELSSSKDEVLNLFATLSHEDDGMWPSEKWPAMKFKNGLKVGAEGGHGPIRYKVVDYSANGYVEFRFQKPIGLNGIHKFEVASLNGNKTLIKHTIDMETTGYGTLNWIFAVRWLHDALIVDAFDKMENQLGSEAKKSEWNLWVKILRGILNQKKRGS